VIIWNGEQPLLSSLAQHFARGWHLRRSRRSGWRCPRRLP